MTPSELAKVAEGEYFPMLADHGSDQPFDQRYGCALRLGGHSEYYAPT